jgi:hypothetical protein
MALYRHSIVEADSGGALESNSDTTENPKKLDLLIHT